MHFENQALIRPAKCSLILNKKKLTKSHYSTGRESFSCKTKTRTVHDARTDVVYWKDDIVFIFRLFTILFNLFSINTS